METIGIGIPTYDRGNLLKELLDSLIEQVSEFNIPIFISDNNSSDDTEQIVKKFNLRYNNITYNKNNTNLGVYGNILQVIKMMNTEYIWLIGDDDKLKDGSLREVMRLISEKHDFIVLNSKVFDREFKKIRWNRIIDCSGDRIYQNGEHNELISDLRKASYFGFISSMIIKRILIDKIILKFDGNDFLLEGNIWLPTMMYYEAIVGHSGIFVCDPYVYDRSNVRITDKNAFEYMVIDKLRALGYLANHGYDLATLRRCAEFGLLSAVSTTSIAKMHNPTIPVFNTFIKRSLILPTYPKFILFLLDHQPQLIVRMLFNIASKFRYSK